ncbi:MAG: dienelactone hydrolase family protein [Verrucomicrobia bacterium]|nr:dienelactone hydrolase family protein [Verrucomicrobiota bacterium]
MSPKCFLSSLILVTSLLPGTLFAEETTTLPGTQPLTMEGDLSAQMVAGIDKFLMREIDRSIVERQKLWQRDFSSREVYEKSVQPNRERFGKYIGAVDPRLSVIALEYVSSTTSPLKLAETDAFTVFAVRWPVFENVYGEGLLLQPKNAPLARVVAIPDADQTPEMLVGLSPDIARERQFARRLAESGCQVLVPTLINREDTSSGSEKLKRFTNQPHREWIYRQAFEMGRHIIGYEVQKVLAAVDWFAHENSGGPSLPIGVAGYAEGGLIAFYSAALDTRIDATLVSGYFDSRQHLWEEPIYRNVFGLLHEFGDAEIASLIAPRSLIVEHSIVPKVDGPPKPHDGRGGAAPGKLKTPDYESVEVEFNRAKMLLKSGGEKFVRLELITGTEGMATGPGSDRALTAFLKQLGLKIEQVKESATVPADARKDFDPAQRQQRQVKQLEDHTQRLLRQSERVRTSFFWNWTKVRSPDEWASASKELKTNFWEEVIGKFPAASLPANPRSRKLRENSKWTAYEVVLDVWPDVYAWGYLLLPKDIKPGERRPVVVCQHGLEGVPDDTVSEDPKGGGYPYYKAFSARLAEKGFVVFAPHNPYRGQDKFRVLQRKANPLKKSLFSVILAQHDRILDWLSEQPFVDPKRIGFYGLSYGGKTAMRVPSLLDRYCLSICSADFNEWIVKNVTVDSPYSYMFSGEYEMVEFNLGHTFNYAEMAALIAPRPFMVERGHGDGVAPDEWVAYEYAKVRRFYDQLGIGDRTALEVFNGPHTINGMGTYEFLEKHLNWQPPR